MSNPSLKTVIFSAPPGWGKTHHQEALAVRLGCGHVVDEWRIGRPLEAGALHLTNITPHDLSTMRGIDTVAVCVGWAGYPVTADEFLGRGMNGESHDAQAN